MPVEELTKMRLFVVSINTKASFDHWWLDRTPTQCLVLSDGKRFLLLMRIDLGVLSVPSIRLVCKAKKSDHIHPILETLHWLPVTHRIQYKISTICFNSTSGTAPQYQSDLLQPYTPARQLWSASDTRTFVTSHVNTEIFGERAFSYAGPSVQNSLPQTLCHSDSASSFKAALKMHLFNNYF